MTKLCCCSCKSSRRAQRGFQGFYFFQHFQESLSVGQVEAGEPFMTQCHHYDTPFSECSQWGVSSLKACYVLDCFPIDFFFIIFIMVDFSVSFLEELTDLSLTSEESIYEPFHLQLRSTSTSCWRLRWISTQSWLVLLGLLAVRVRLRVRQSRSMYLMFNTRINVSCILQTCFHPIIQALNAFSQSTNLNLKPNCQIQYSGSWPRNEWTLMFLLQV